MSEGVNQSLLHARRVLVLGCPGAGKSTFSRRLSVQTGLPVYHLDDEYWGPYWARPTDPFWEAKQEALTARERWIIDGNYLLTLRIRASKADLIVLLDTPALTCVRRIFFRAWCIRRGHYDALPAQVRDQALAGQRVPATKDLLPLMWKVLRFRRDDFGRLIKVLGAATGAPILIAAARQPSRRRLRTMLRGACRSCDVKVISLTEAGAFCANLCSGNL